jgi:hypothetical protein
MTKKLSLALIVALVLSVFFTASAFAGCGKCPSKAGCAAKAADQKGGCTHGKDDKGCTHMADMKDAMAALEKDLATMEKGIPAADQAAFMKAHQANLKKLIDTRAACMKECQAKADKKDETKPAAVKEAPKT